MESPIPRYAGTREASRKGSSPRTSPPPDYTEKTTYIKFLVSNAEAGSVIGKRGSTINDFQSQSGARIQISGNQEFFPGTSDRIIMVSGTFDEILKALELILVRLVNEFYAEDGDHADIRSKVRLIATNSSCGGIIGKGGATIKSFIKDSRAGIKVSPQDNSYIGLNDRTVTIDGTLEEIMRAVELILLKFTEDPQYARSFGVPFSYASVMFAGFTGVPHPYMLPPVAAPAYGPMNYGPDRARGKFPSNKEDRGNSVTIGVADEHIGLVVGRGGRNLAEISQVSGARIKISDRGDFISGTSNRKVTITGSQKAIRIAEAMIYYKAAYVSES